MLDTAEKPINLVGGIDFQSIYDSQSPTGDILSLSGRTLHYIKSKNKITVYDTEYPQFKLSTWYDPKECILEFNVHTRSNEPSILTRFPEGVHPDMRAGDFIRHTYDRTIDEGLTIKGIASDWSSESDNYKVFKSNYKNFGPVGAAQKTWGAQQYAKLGFTQLRKEEVKVLDLDTPDGVVRAIFRKP